MKKFLKNSSSNVVSRLRRAKKEKAILVQYSL
jgi:hypothetical protein